MAVYLILLFVKLFGVLEKDIPVIKIFSFSSSFATKCTVKKYWEKCTFLLSFILMGCFECWTNYIYSVWGGKTPSGVRVIV